MEVFMEQQIDKTSSESSEVLEQIHRCGQEILDEFVKICEQNNFRYYLIAGTLLGAVRHKGPIPWDDDVDVAMPRKDMEEFKKLMLARPEGEQYHVHCFENDPNFLWFLIRFMKRGTIYSIESFNNVDLRYKELWLDIFPLDEIPKNSGLRHRFIAMRIGLMQHFVSIKSRNSTAGMYTAKKLVYHMLKPLSFKWLRSHTERLMCKWNGKGCKYYVSWASKYNYKKETMPKEWYEPVSKLIYNDKYYAAPHEWNKVLKQLYGDYMKLPPENERVGHSPLELKL